MSFLADAHRDDLRRSGLNEETITGAGVYSAPERQVRDILGYGAGPGLVFPYRALNGSNGSYARVKLDHADAEGKRYRSPAKTPNHLYVPALLELRVLQDTSTPLWLVEGEKKALKGAQEGLACLAVSGVWSWRTRQCDDGKSVPIPDLDHIAWRTRTVYLVFDSDLTTNPSVKLAEFALARELQRRGARLFAVRLPGGPQGAKVGLDDYLLTHSVEALCQLAPIEIRNPALRARPEIVTARELLQRTYPEAPAIVDAGVIVRGSLNVLGGPPKVGKSALSLNLGLCRSFSRPWLGFRTTPGRTLIVQAEIPERELQTRLRVMLRDHEPLADKAIWFVTHRGTRLDRTDGLRECRNLVEQVRPDLLILDPLARFYGGDENSAREVGRLIGALDDLIQTYRVAILLDHHTAKPSAQDPREGGLRLRGSSALFAAVDSALILDRNEDGFRLSFELRHGKPVEPLRLERTERLWFVPAGPPDDLLAVADIVKDIRLKWSGLVGAVEKDLECSRSTAERLVRRAQKAGLIAQDDARLYHQTVTNLQNKTDGEGSADE